MAQLSKGGTVPAASPRWVSVSDSEFAHERAGLEHVRALLPDRAPYRAWSNFEFRDSSGKWHEVDLLVLGERRLHLVELKHYAGRIDGTAYRWQRNGRSEDSPIRLARRKAQRLKSVIIDELRKMGAPPGAAPFVQECIFLHAGSTQCALPAGDRTDLFGLDGARHSGLPSIVDRLLEPPDGKPARLIESDALATALFDRIGFTLRREREVGSWRITGSPEGEGDGWQDWPAEHRITHREQVTIRFFVHPTGTREADLATARRVVSREYELAHRLRHDGLLAPRDLVDDDLGAGLVFDRDPAAQRLDLWLADRPQPPSLAMRLGLIRMLAEALDYAHRNHVVHRGLSPEAIWITGDPPVARIGDWQISGRDIESDTQHEPGLATRLFRDLVPSGDAVERQAGAYVAPEGRWSAGADRIKLDVFGLGAVAYFLLTGFPPAEHSVALRERLRRDHGLDIAAHLSEATPALRELVLRATRPTVGERCASTAEFLALLGDTEQDATVTTSEPSRDPLDTVQGAALDERFTLVSRLGSGSTAVGLLVRDGTDGQHRVLKVARDDSAVSRLLKEADILRTLPGDPHLVRLVEPQAVTIGNRTALLLESAGPSTLATELRAVTRLSLDLLQRWGTDLLSAVVALDRAGIDHRDIKPGNLGVRERRGDRTKHLVLFDFSLSAAGTTDLDAGTRPYLDPFLGSATRPRWDSAAERYAAAVTLFEMATGQPPSYAEDGTAAEFTEGEVLLADALFDPSMTAPLAAFFSRALRRDARLRFDTAEEMRAAWTAIFDANATRLPDDSDARADAATPHLSLAEAGLSPRALSAAEQLGVTTVGELIAIEQARLTKLRGSSVATRRELADRAKQWRARFTDAVRASPPSQLEADIDAAARHLLDHVASKRAPGRERAIAAILGIGDDVVEPFASLADLGAALGGQAAPQVHNHITAAVAEMTGDERCRQILDAVHAQVEALVLPAGGLLYATSLGTGISGDEAAAAHQRIAAGLARLALERADLNEREGDGPAPIARRRRRRDGTVVLASPPQLLDVIEPLGRRADEVVAAARAAGEPVTPAARAASQLREVWPAGVTAPDDASLVTMAAGLSTQAAASGQAELYPVDLSVADAAGLALAGFTLARRSTAGTKVLREDVLARIRTRFPAVTDLPSGAALDALLQQAGADLKWGGPGVGYVPRYTPPGTTGLASSTWTPSGPLVDRSGEQREDRLLAESRSAASFLALGVRPAELDHAGPALRERFGAVEVDITAELIDALRGQASKAGIGWDDVAAADAADPGSRAAAGLARLVAAVVPNVLARVADLAAETPAGSRPVLLTEAAPLARYGHLAGLARFTDITAHRSQAVWLLFPTSNPATAEVDGVPVPLAHGGQALGLDRAWIRGEQIGAAP